MTSSLPGVDSTVVQDTAMTHSTHEQRLSLITQMMCCLIAADAKVSSSEIDVVYDALVGIGLPVTHDEFRTRVIEACKAIHKNGALQVASSLAAPLEAFRRTPLSKMLLQLQDDVIRVDGQLTESEKVVARVFSDALRGDVEPPLVDAGGTAVVGGEGVDFAGACDDSDWGDEVGGEPSRVTLEIWEQPFAFLLNLRQQIDSHAGSRLLVAALVGVVLGSCEVFRDGSLSDGIATMLWWFIVAAVFLVVPSDRVFWSLSYAPAERRSRSRVAAELAAEVISAISTPPAVQTDGLEAVETSDNDVADAENAGDGLTLKAAYRLLAGRGLSAPRRSRVARHLCELLRGSTRSGYGRSAFRCTSCGRKYWFRLGQSFGVICPFCGVFQHATLDWVPSTTQVAAEPPPVWRRPAATPTYSYGPVSVRGYVNKNGTWVTSHSRSRPRRRR
jgi:uncharacterized tellurite resistance protein B-like protein